MPDSRLLEFSAVLAVQQRLIQDLLFNYLGRMEKPFAALDAYAKGFEASPIRPETPHIDAVESDLLDQLISEALARSLEGVRSDLEKRVRHMREQHQGRPPKEQT
jgi:hypothetical protein